MSRQAKKKKSKFTQFRRRITYSEPVISCIAFLAFCLIWIYNQTLKITIEYHPDFKKEDRDKVLFGFWHGRQFLLVPNFGHWNIAIMTDLSWAGAIQFKILQRFGFTIVRGSSKRKGVRALLNMKNALASGCAAAFALDGPRGPLYQSKPGIYFLAKKMNYPVVPVAISADKAWILKNTWCRYLLPKPFSRCLIAFGQPVKNITDEDVVSGERLDKILINWVEEADCKMGREPEIIPSRK